MSRALAILALLSLAGCDQGETGPGAPESMSCDDVPTPEQDQCRADESVVARAASCSSDDLCAELRSDMEAVDGACSDIQLVYQIARSCGTRNPDDYCIYDVVRAETPSRVCDDGDSNALCNELNYRTCLADLDDDESNGTTPALMLDVLDCLSSVGNEVSGEPILEWDPATCETPRADAASTTIPDARLQIVIECEESCVRTCDMVLACESGDAQACEGFLDPHPVTPSADAIAEAADICEG